MKHFLMSLGLNFSAFGLYTLGLGMINGSDGYFIAFFGSVAHAALSVIVGIVLIVVAANGPEDRKHLNPLGIGLIVSGLVIPVIGFGVCATNVSFH